MSQEPKCCGTCNREQAKQAGNLTAYSIVQAREAYQKAKEQSMECPVEVSRRYLEAKELLERCRKVLQRQGWEDSESVNDVEASVSEFLDAEALEEDVFGKHTSTAEKAAFVAGAQACREMMARFVAPQDVSTAQSIRANWHPGWGKDPGKFDGDIPTLPQPQRSRP